MKWSKTQLKHVGVVLVCLQPHKYLFLILKSPIEPSQQQQVGQRCLLLTDFINFVPLFDFMLMQSVL